MIYLVKADQGVEIEVSKALYDYHKNIEGYQCRVIGNDIPSKPELLKPIKPENEPVKMEKPEAPAKEKYPKPDESGPWYTLSNGKRIKGKANAHKAQNKL